MSKIMSRPIQHHHQTPNPHRVPPSTLSVNLTTSSPLDFTDRIPFKEIEISKHTLGSGSYGTVFKGLWRGRHVAVKQFKTREEIDSFLIEVKQLSCVKHPNIVTLYGASTLTDTAYLIMEYAEGGSLNYLLHECKQQEYDLRHACSWAMQTARGVAYLHGIRPKPIMHRDLKPANLLLFNRGKILKICDFGTACAVKTQMTNNTGSASYMAPEVFATSSYLESGDVFSWSIIFWEILARRQPYSQKYSNPYQILWLVKQEGVRPTELEDCPEIIWNLITRSWHKDPKMRPCMREVAEQMEFISAFTEHTPTPSSATNTSRNSSITPTRSTHHWSPISSPQHIDGQHRQNQPLLQVHHQQEHLKSPQNHQHQNFHISSLKSLNMKYPTPLTTRSMQECSTHVKRELSNRSRALVYRLEMLKNRAIELEKSTLSIDSSDGSRRHTSWDLVAEYEELKKETELKKQQLHAIQSSTFSCKSFKTNT